MVIKRIIIICIALYSLLVQVYAQNRTTEHARNLMRQEKYVEAAKVLRPLADSGDAEAQYLASSLFFQGKGVIKSETQAMKYLVMAVKQYHIGATVQYVMKTSKTQEKDKLLNIIEDCLAHNPKAANSQLVYMLYQLDENKEKGWKLISDCETTEQGDYLMNRDDKLNRLEQVHESFYTYLIDTYIDTPEVLRSKLLSEYLRSASRDKGFKWAHESISYLVQKLEISNKNTQIKNYNLWQKESMFMLFRSICAYMKYTGMGVSKDLTRARTIAIKMMEISQGDSSFPWINKHMRRILDTYEPGMSPMPNITVMSVDGDSVTLYNGNAQLKTKASDLTDRLLNMQKKQTELDAQKSNIKVRSNREGIIVDANPHLEYKQGNLNLMFVVTTNTPNHVRFTVKSVGLTNETHFKGATYEVIGLERKSSLMVIPPNKKIYIKVRISGVPSSGYFKQVSVTYDSDYGNGYFLINNLIW